jgi:hypothetical protein
VKELFVALYFAGWLIFSFSFFGVAHAYLFLCASMFFLFSGTRGWRLLPQADSVLFGIPLASAMMAMLSLCNFIFSGDFAYVAKSMLYFVPIVFFVVLPQVRWARFVLFLLFFAVLTSLLSVTVFSYFHPAHFKFVPKYKFAFVTSNNISFYLTMLLCLVFVVARWTGFKSYLLFSILVFSVLMHFSKAHIASVFIAGALSIFFMMKWGGRTLVLLLFLLFLCLGWAGEDFVRAFTHSLDIKPLIQIVEGLYEAPRLVDRFGWQGLLFLVEDVGDVGRAGVYLNGFGNISQLGVLGGSDELVFSTFRGMDYHNTLLYISYDLGVLSLIVFLLSMASLFFVAGRLGGQFKFVYVFIVFYSLIRMLFISVDVSWLYSYFVFFSYAALRGDKRAFS